MDAFIAPLSTSIRQPTCPHYALRCSKFHGFAAHPNVITPPKRAKSFVLSTAGLPQPTQKCIDGKTLLRLAVLVSGSGRSLENICQKIETSQLTGCQVCVVVTSKSTAAAVQRAEKYHIPTRVVRSKDFPGGVRPFSDAISAVLDDFGVDLVVMAGWLHFYQIPPRYDGKVINIHPSLIPAFCGKGFYGKRVHEAVLKFGAKVTGCTVHLADNKYDHGPIILQKPVPVLDSDSADDLASRVFESEKEALPEAIQLLLDNRLLIREGVVRVIPKLQSELVEQ